MKFFKKPEWKLFYPLYTGLGIGIAIPDIDMIVMVFFFSKGFTATQIGIGLALQSFFLLIAEIPTGVFADVYGKRKAIQISWFMQSAIFALFFFITTPWMMWFLFSVKGIAYTFSTGAYDGLPYEIAKREKKEYLISKFYQINEFVYQSASSLSSLNVIVFLFFIGATKKYYVFHQTHQGLDFLWITGSIGYFIGSLILFKLKENVKKVRFTVTEQVKNTCSLAYSAVSYSRNHPVISKLVFMSIFMEIITMLFSDIVYQPFLLTLKISVEEIAIVVAIGSFFGAFFSIIPQYITKKFATEKQYIEGMFLLKIVILGCLFFFTGPFYSIIFFFIYFGIDSLINPVLTPFKQNFYKDEMRATLGSVESVIKNITSIIFFPLIGYALDLLKPKTTVLLALVPLIICYFILRNITHKFDL